MLVGFTISPILWNCVSKTHENSLSAGRCQTPALRLIYDNYVDIKQSPGKLIYDVTGYFTSLTLLFELNKQFTTEIQVQDFLEACKSVLQTCIMYNLIFRVGNSIFQSFDLRSFNLFYVLKRSKRST